MSVTPGAANKLNHVSGIASAISLTEEDIQNPSLMGKILPKGFFINFPDGQIAVTDGTTTIGSLSKSVDKLLIGVEKDALVKTFSGLDKTYKATSGGFLVLGTDAKIDPISMPATVYDTATGKIKLDALPDSVRAGVSTIADYAGLSTVSEEQKKGLILVLDASADASVDKGAAMYQWVSDKNTFLKIAEVESLDIDVAALRPNYQNIQAAGAIMYDHPVIMEPPSLTDMVALMEASLNNPGQPLETASYMEMPGSGGNFIFRIENESQVVAYWNTNGGNDATFITGGKPAFKLVMGPSANGMHYFYASGIGAKTGDTIVWTEISHYASFSNSDKRNIAKLSSPTRKYSRRVNIAWPQGLAPKDTLYYTAPAAGNVCIMIQAVAGSWYSLVGVSAEDNTKATLATSNLLAAPAGNIRANIDVAEGEKVAIAYFAPTLSELYFTPKEGM